MINKWLEGKRERKIKWRSMGNCVKTENIGEKKQKICEVEILK